jgi:dihydroorotate dehydrogenase electron transfer subunit
MKEMYLQQASVVANEGIAPDIFSMKLYAPDIAKTALAGQFVMVYLDRGEMPLPRPISICDTDTQTGIIELVYQVIGKGTRVMSEIKAGADIRLLAPLGNGFKLAQDIKCAAIVGGGIGVPPLFFLAKTFAESGVEFDVFLGFRTSPILVERFQEVTKHGVFVATEDGSAGHHGRVTDILQARNEKYGGFFACGPVPMLRALAEYAKRSDTPCWVSMEERMACGLGTCVGCVVKAGESYVRICSEGPVFNSNEVLA